MNRAVPDIKPRRAVMIFIVLPGTNSQMIEALLSVFTAVTAFSISGSGRSMISMSKASILRMLVQEIR
jgi:hypothetical protein